MKLFFIYSLFLFFTTIFFGCNNYNLKFSENSVISPAELWLDNNHEHINAHGGGVLFHNGKYYWFGEHKSENSNSALVGVTCYSSSDLVNWEFESIALPVSDDESSDIVKGSIIERPKVIYNKKTEKFVMWFHLELKGRGYAAARSGIAVSDNVEGPYTFIRSGRVNPSIYPFNMTEIERNMEFDFEYYNDKWWTPEWHDEIKYGMFVKRDFESGQMARDMTLFVDDNEKAYHIYASEDNLTLHIAELSDDYLSHTGKYIRIFPGGHNEAPAIFKKDDEYWMITSGCTGWEPNEARLLHAPTIWGPWRQLPNPARGKNAHITFGAQSTYVIKVENHKNKYIFMADKWKPHNPIDGRYVWLPIMYDNNNIPYFEWKQNWNLNEYLNN